MLFYCLFIEMHTFYNYSYCSELRYVGVFISDFFHDSVFDRMKYSYHEAIYQSACQLYENLCI